MACPARLAKEGHGVFFAAACSKIALQAAHPLCISQNLPLSPLRSVSRLRIPGMPFA